MYKYNHIWIISPYIYSFKLNVDRLRRETDKLNNKPIEIASERGLRKDADAQSREDIY